MSNKQEAIKSYYKGMSKKFIEENNLNLQCLKEPSTGIFFMWDDGSNPIFGKGHSSPQKAWAETLKWLKERR